MKFRLPLLLLIAACSLSACVSLAEDITPPPNYISPTPAPTMGPLFPEQVPSPANGAPIYAEKCAPCHGDTGLGNGPQSKMLSVNVPAIGLPEILSQYSPASYYTTVTQGRMDKMMPPFASLTDAERWDVVAYVYTLSASPEQVAQGKAIYEANCVNCHGPSGTQAGNADFTNPQYMAQRTMGDFTRFITAGGSGMPGFANLSTDEVWAVASYVRTFSFGDAPLAAAAESTPTPEPATATPETTATPAATPEGTVTPAPTSDGTTTPEAPQDGTTTPESPTEAAPSTTTGAISGTLKLPAGVIAVPDGTTVTLTAYSHGDNSSAPEQVAQLTATVKNDGSYTFEGVEMPNGRFYVIDVTYGGIAYQGMAQVGEDNVTSLTVDPITVYESTKDYSTLKFERVHIGFNFPDSQTIQIFNIYIFSNTSDKTIVVDQSGQSAIPFIEFPAGAVSTGYEDGGIGGTFVAAEGGFAIPPSDQQYGIVAYYNLPYPEKVEISTSFKLPVDAVIIFAQPGVEIEGQALTAGEIQDINGFSYNTYKTSAGIAKDDSLTFTISGKPASSDQPVTTTTKKMDTATIALIAAGVLGLILIGAGIWMFMRDRNEDDEDENEDEAGEQAESASDESADALIDAINALDDQYKGGNLSQEVYEERRAELKSKLKNMI